VSVVVLMALLALAAMPVAARTPDVLIYGRVRDVTNDKGLSVATPAGDPVDAPAVVELVKPNGAVLTSTALDANGDFLFQLPVQPGLYTVRVASIPANYGATLVGTRLNPDQTVGLQIWQSMLSAAFFPGVSQVPILVAGMGWYGYIDFEYSAAAKPDDVCNTPAWSYIHGMAVVANDPMETSVIGMVFQLERNYGTAAAPDWRPVYRGNGNRVFFASNDRGIFGVGISYLAGQYRISTYSTPPVYLPIVPIVFTLNPCGTDNTIPQVQVALD